LNERKPKAVDEDVARPEEPEEADVPCSDSSDSDQGEKEDYEQSVERARALLTSSRLVSNEAEVAFPDTVVDLGTSTTTRQRQASTATEDDTYLIIEDIADAPKKGSKSSTAPVPAPKKAVVVAQEKGDAGDTEAKAKRGQKGKLKKIKEKYANQDEEERQLRMQLLQSAGPARDKGKNKKNKKGDKQKNNSSNNKELTAKPRVHFKEETTTCSTLENAENAPPQPANPPKPNEETGDVDAVDDENEPTSTDVDILNALTGIPLTEDELLYVVPVVAPYSTLTTYKYKVKIIPGQSKRGKASKSALQVFMADKAATNRERDLIKSLKDQDIGRNLPGKVKLAVPQSLKPKKYQ